MEGRAPASLGDRRTFVGVAELRPPRSSPPSNLVTRDPQINSRQGSDLRLRTAPARRSRFANLNPLLHSNAVTTPNIMRRSTVSLALLVCLSLLIALGTASAQLAPTRKAPRNEPLEKYDNPPAPPRKIETSPRMISQFGVFTSYQVNVDANGQNIIGDAANECSISVDPTDGNKMTIAWRQFNDVNSNFRQGGWGYTTDGGIHWTFPGV